MGNVTEERLREIIREALPPTHTCPFSEEDRVKLRWVISTMNKTASVIGWAFLAAMAAGVLWLASLGAKKIG